MILSQRYLKEQAEYRNISEHIGYRKTKIINENYELAEKYDSTIGKKIKKYDIFLSHSSLDKSLVLTLVELFNEAKYSVYIDWIEDIKLDRNHVTKNTAVTLKRRMNDSAGLAYVATSNATNSKWCPWELGYFDGKKNNRCSILPIVESKSFDGQEYLGLYPYIEYEKTFGTDNYDFWVNEQGTSNYINLREWLEGKDPFQH